MADDGEVRIKPVKKTFIFATVFGILIAFKLIIAAITLGGVAGSFFNLPVVLIVLGGTFAVTTICFSFQETDRTFSVINKTIFYTTRDPADAALQIAQFARCLGVLSLQDILNSLKSEPFLQKGVSMLGAASVGRQENPRRLEMLLNSIIPPSKRTQFYQ